jgi:ABC-2 type transport system permease protein
MRNKRDILKILVATDFKLRYQNSVLGVIWVVLKPFLLFLILYLVFSFLFGQKDPNYKLNLFLGIILINYFQEGTTLGLFSLLSRANIILKVNFPREIALYASLAQASISLFFNLVVFSIFWVFSPTPLKIFSLPSFLLYIIILALLIQGLNFFLSILYVKFRDLASIWEVVNSLVFFATPVFYPLSVIPAKYHSLVFLNPLAVIIHNSREVLIRGELPDLPRTGLALLLAIVLFTLGLLFFRKKVKKIAEDF